jgi:hypothetical protein
MITELGMSSPEDFKTQYLVKSVFSKFVSQDTDPDNVRRQRAIFKWLCAEANNAATNDRLSHIDGEYNILPRVTYDTFMDRVRSIVVDVLGDTVSEEALRGSFSGGASTSRRRTESHPSSKYLGEAHITDRALPWITALIGEYSLWHEYGGLQDLTVVPGNVLFTVPKSTSIDRCAAKEPDLNMYMQKGAGDFIRKRLRFHGIDLNDQTKNQNLARRGSIDGTLATLDLSSASDSISCRLVEECLPTLWWSFLSDLRSPRTLIEGEWHENEMFSSMGNGFTFELESLLFYAFARATAWSLGVPGIISVYGDDIIVPTEIAHELTFVLQVLGFATNIDKSFIDGPFRESCGGHFISGFDVTPFYVKAPILRLVDLIHVCNSIRKWADVKNGMPILCPLVYDMWLELASHVPDIFWGGYDCSDKSRLVSPPRVKNPRRLVAKRHKKSTGDGGYLYAHNLMDSTSSLEDPVSQRVIESKSYKVKPARRNEPLTRLFYEEVACQEVNKPE